MALVLKDRVKETSSSSGLSNITLSGAFAGYQTFNSAVASGSTVYYTIHNLVPGFDTEWEVGVGTFTAPSTLSRDTILSSSTGSKVNFTSGTEGLEVFITQPAEEAVYINQATGNVEAFGNGTNNISFTTITANNAVLSYGTVNATPSNGTDITNKTYVDTIASSGLHYHQAVNYERPNTDGNLAGTYADGGTTPTWTDITNNKEVATGSAHGLNPGDVIVFGSTTNGITAGTGYFVKSTPTSTSITLTLTYDGAEITSLTNGTGLSITSRANSGVGATLTNSGANVALVIDGITVSNGNRILIYNQTNAYENGVYTVTNAGAPDSPGPGSAWVLTRASDANTYAPNSDNTLGQGDVFYVTGGNTGAGESYVMATSGTIIFGTTNLTFNQISSAQVYSAGTGLNLANLTFSIANTAVTAATYDGDGNTVSLTVNAQGQLTNVASVPINASSISVGTLSNDRTTANASNGASTIVARDTNGSFTANTITATDVNSTNVTATTGAFTNVSGNGSAISAINASNISSGTIANARTTGNTANSASTLVLRDSDGSFGANIVTATFSGNGASLSAINASNISSGTIANARTTAASANGASTIVLRDLSGNFEANTVNAVSLIGNAAQVTNINASNISSGTIANARTTASSSNGASTIVLRDAGGAFAAGAITATSLSGNGASITDINASSITTGTIANARTTASSANGASTIVARDANGSFSANVVTVNNVSVTTGLFGNGSNTAPSISFTNSTGTGLFLPAANTIAFTEGGVEAMRITSTGDVGIGTSSPTNIGAGFVNLEVNGSTSGLISVSAGGVRAFTASADGNQVNIQSRINGQPMLFYTNGGSVTERMRIDSSGNVAINTTVATDRLTISGGNNAIGFVGNGTAVNFRNGAGTLIQRIYYDDSDGSLTFGGSPSSSAYPLKFTTGQSERMRITSGGDVGIGTGSPSYAVDIRNAASTALRVGSSNNAFGSLLSWDNPTGTGRLWTLGAYDFVFGTNSTERMRITSGGFVGIGTSSPGMPLEVNGTGYVTDLLIRNSGGTPSLGTSPWLYSPASGTLAIATNASERMRIDSSGNVGIGTSSPFARLNVISTASTTNTALRIESSGSLANNDILRVQINGLTNGMRMFQDASSNVIYSFQDGNVGIGTTSPATLLNLSKAVSGGLGPEIRLNNDAGAANDSARISFAYATSLRAALDMQIHPGGNGEFIFSNGVGTLTERMRITASGTVGIGTSSPGAKLEVFDTSDVAARIHKSGVAQWNIGVDTVAFAQTDSAMTFRISGTERMRIFSSGGVSIGNTTDPGATNLSVTGSVRSPAFTGDGVSGSSIYDLPDTGGSSNWIFLGTWTASQIGQKLNIKLVISTGFNASIAQNAMYDIFFKTSNGSSFQAGSSGNFFADGTAWKTGPASTIQTLRVIQNSSTSYAIYAFCENYTGVNSFYNVSISNGTWTNSGTIATPSGNFVNLPIYTYLDSNNASSFVSGAPTGSLLMWSTNSAPSGYLLCDGSNVSRTTFAALFAVIGTTYGAGDGSTTFGLPNFTDRMAIGSGNLYSLAGTGGSKDAIVVSHTHTITDPNHRHPTGGNNAGGQPSGNWLSSLNSLGSNQTQVASTGISINTTGSSGTNANLPPYLAVRFIIKT